METRYRFTKHTEKYKGWVQKSLELSDYAAVCETVEELDELMYALDQDATQTGQKTPDRFLQHLKALHGLITSSFEHRHYENLDGCERFWRAVEQFRATHAQIESRRKNG